MIRPGLCAILPARMRTLLPFLLIPALACGSSRVSFTGEVKYGKTAEDDYNAGVEEAKSENWTEAVKFLEHCRTKYPFSRFATLAELKLADIRMEQERYVEAAEAYGTFARMHPTHERADYAAYREGQALILDGPSDFFLLPPAYERELKTPRDGAAKLEAFLAKWPDSKLRPDAERLLSATRTQLAEHEWYAAGFYAKRRHWAGAAGRYQTLVTKYPGTPHEVEALFALADTWVKLEDRFKARQALQEIVVKHAGDPRRARAEKLLAELR
jgi:outer membrane protein assembly factor BamD